jgi:alanine dehydrogenase
MRRGASVLVISNHDVNEVLDAKEAIVALEGAYRDLANGDAICRPRIDMRFPTGESSKVYQWGTMEGGSSASGYFAIRAKSDILEETGYGGTRTQEKYCVSPGTFCGFVLLFSVRNGEPLALINDGVLQHMRVGADSAIGTRLMAKKDAKTLGMIGSGGMARSHLDSLLNVLPIDSVRVFSPTPANREAYAKEMRDRFGIDVVAVAEPSLACADADIVCGCTDAVTEVIRGEWLEEGTHVTCVGGRLAPSALARIDVWLRLGTAPPPINLPEWATPAEVVSYRAQPDNAIWKEHQFGEGGGRGLSGVDPAKTIFLADLLEEKVSGRSDAREVTFSERGNIQGAQFFAVAGRVYELARARGLGHEIPTEWFLQDIRD